MRTITLVGAALLLSACATIFSGGGGQSMSITSVPDASTLTVTDHRGFNVHAGTTPATLKLRRGAGYFKPETYTVTIAKPGYKTRTVAIRSTINGWYFGNILLGGLIGMVVVDALTGAMFRLTPREVSARLDADAPVLTTNQEGLTIMLAQDVPAAMWSDVPRIDQQ